MSILSGVLMLVHAEGAAYKAKLARPSTAAKFGQAILAGMEPGEYAVETSTINEMPEGEHLCFLARWKKVF